jgi:LysR family transcriptional regulator, hydrogen peroxide-inducible genes activator
MRDLAASSQHGLHGTLRLGVPPTLGPYLLPHIVPALHARHPELRLYVREDTPASLHVDLEAGRFDLVVTPLPVQAAGLAVERLFREPLRVVVAHDHPLAGAGQLDRRDLAGEKVLAIERGHHLHAQVSDICAEHGAVLLRDYEGTSLDALRLMVGMGLGLAFLPALYVRSEIGGRADLRVLDLARPQLYRQIGMAWRTTSVHGDEFVALAELIRAIARDTLPEVTVAG